MLSWRCKSRRSWIHITGSVMCWWALLQLMQVRSMHFADCRCSSFNLSGGTERQPPGLVRHDRWKRCHLVELQRYYEIGREWNALCTLSQESLWLTMNGLSFLTIVVSYYKFGDVRWTCPRISSCKVEEVYEPGREWVALHKPSDCRDGEFG